MEDLELVTVKEVAEMLKCTPKHIYSLVKRGKFPAQVKIGDASRWKLSEVRDWLNGLFEQRRQAA